MIKDYEGKVAVVTGGGSGIGRSLAHAFAKNGMKIVLADVDEKSLETVSDELKAGGTEVMTMIVDVSDYGQVSKLADSTFDRFGKADILCNNAGVGTGGPMRLLKKANWDWVLGVNLNGVIYGITCFLQRMLDSGEQCHIVNTASMAGLLSGGDGNPYSASKYAVVAISEGLRSECQNTNVGVSVLCPEFVSTELLKNSEKLRETRSDLFQPTDDMIEDWKPFRENFEKQFYSGMHPDKLAEKVIEAIELDLLYIITHPVIMPFVRTRFDAIQSDSDKLNKDFDPTANIRISGENVKKPNTYNHDSPAFSISYPADWNELNPVVTGDPNLVLLAVGGPGYAVTARVFDIPRDIDLKDIINVISPNAKDRPEDVKIVSNKQTKLKDGTQTNEVLIEYRDANRNKMKIKDIIVSVFKDNKWIMVATGGPCEFYHEDNKEILYSLELK